MPVRIAMVGGGIASFVAGITLREKLPDAQITLYCGTDETLLGGQLASWDEQGYPIEHGLHALFGFYDHVLPILKKIGAYENLTRSKEHIFVHERGAIHRFDLRTWPATYHGFTLLEKLRSLAAAPAILKLVLDVRRKGCGVFDAYDHHDLRTLARLHSVPESILQSGFFRQFYEAAFNAPGELSAAVALESIYKIFSKKWHYYFNLPTRESIVAPLQRHFTDVCGGRIEFNHRLISVRTDDVGSRVVGLDFESPPTGAGKRCSVDADEYVLALGLEDFKRVHFGASASQHEYFRNVQKLRTVSSFSIQGWFKEDPVPPQIDSMVTGMPRPFGILCPITRVRAMQSPQVPPLPYELIATGPERGFEDIPDEAIKTGFIQGLRDAGFRIPSDPLHMRLVLRRNRDSFHRYLLTEPGHLALRPAHQSPLQNLCLAGAWVRNDFALPCVDAAAEGAIKVAGLIAARALAPAIARASPTDSEARRFVGMPRSAPLVQPPPYHFPRSTGSFFLLDANRERLAEAISPDLKLFPGLGSKILFASLRHDEVHARCDRSGARYGYNEVLLAAFVREKGFSPIPSLGLYPICVYVDDDTAMAAGREVYGFPKKMARINLGEQEVSLMRSGLAPGAAPGPVQPIKVMEAQWSANQPARSVSREGLAGTQLHAARIPFALPSLADLARLIVFYNTRDLTQLELTKVALMDVEVRGVATLHDLHLRVRPSANDPVHLLAQECGGTGEVRQARGVKVELAFSMGAARIVGVAATARH